MTVPEGLTVKFYASDNEGGSGGIVAVGDGREGAVIVGWSDLDNYASEKDGVEFWRRTDPGLITEILGNLLDEANSLVPLARRIWPAPRRISHWQVDFTANEDGSNATRVCGCGETFRGTAAATWEDMVQHERTGFPFLIDGGEGNDPLDIPEDPP